jgi:proline iminopeptidase
MLCLSSMLASALIHQSGGVVVRPDVKLPYKIEGHGAPVLMLSGGPGFTSDYLQSIIDKVGQDKYRWILLEQRGTPRAKVAKPTGKAFEMGAYIDDLEALRKQLGLAHWNVVGQSWGSMLAEAYAAAQPDRTTSLVLLDTPGPDLEWTTYGGDNVSRSLNEEDRKALREATKKDASDPAALVYDTFIAQLPGYFYSRESALKSKEMFQPGCVEGTTINFVFANLTHDKWDISKALHRYRNPALVIQGRQDFLGESAAMKAAHAMPRGELCFVERAGHIAWMDNPGPFFSRLGSFLKRHAK